MRIIFTEGPLDVLLIRTILVKTLKWNDVTRNMNFSIVRSQFQKLLVENQLDGVIRIVRRCDREDDRETIVIVSVEGKDNFEKIATAVRPLKSVAEKINEELRGVLFVGDRDASEILQRLYRPGGEVPILTLVYRSYMEDLLFEIFTRVMGSLDNFELDIYRKILGKVSRFKDTDRAPVWKKRKLSLLHLVFGPKCFENLFEALCSKLKKEETKEIPEIVMLERFLK